MGSASVFARSLARYGAASANEPLDKNSAQVAIDDAPSGCYGLSSLRGGLAWWEDGGTLGAGGMGCH